ncbi:glycerophosphodiester phosphodiesterase family protein [Pontixanthobacter gangjinensis]
MLMTTSGNNKELAEFEGLYSEDDRVLVAAHRGSHDKHPENSLAAIQESINNQIDIVEVDIRETRDKIPVLLHDESLKRTTGSNLKIADVDFKELEEIPLLYQNKETDQRIPSLEEALIISKNKVILNLDFKLDDLQAMKRSYKVVARLGMENSVIFTVRDLDLIPSLYEINPEIRIMPVAFSWWKINQVIKYDFLDIIQLYHRPYGSININRLKSNDFEVWVNALKKYDRLEIEQKNGFENLLNIKKVNVIQTDHPEKLLSFLREKGLHD